jgi:hypothetical protein
MATNRIQNTSSDVDLGANDCSKYDHVEDDTNPQSQVTTGGADADHSIVTCEGGPAGGPERLYDVA